MTRAGGRGGLTGRSSERGAVAVEAALIIPALVMIAAMTAGSWRCSEVRADAQSAAEVAARAASVAGSVDRGEAWGRRAAGAELAGTRCSSPRVDVDASGWSVPVGKVGRTSARVTCVVRLSDLLVPGMPGHITVREQARATIDSHRERQP